MKVEVKIDRECKETRAIVITNEWSDEIKTMVKFLEDQSSILGYQSDTATILEQKDILSIFSSNKKVFAMTKDKEYQIHLRLYELENILYEKWFVRISNSEIVNLKHIKKFDLSLTGTIRIIFFNGNATYVSRRYVSKIKKTLGM